jgi:hypothetical protein
LPGGRDSYLFFIILKDFETTCRINNQKTTESAIIKMNQQAQTNYIRSTDLGGGTHAINTVRYS